MNEDLIISMLNWFAQIDPSPFFVLSLIPYLIFLFWAQRATSIPKTALWGFRLTLLFVAMTIFFAIIALKKYGSELTDIDSLHGAAEAFLTLSDALIVVGFLRLNSRKLVNNS